MMTSSQVLGSKMVAATARFDREIAGSNRNRWLREFTGKIRLAAVWRVPVGFEDETGFHLGVQPVRRNDDMEWERAGIFLGEEQF